MTSAPQKARISYKRVREAVVEEKGFQWSLTKKDLRSPQKSSACELQQSWLCGRRREILCDLLCGASRVRKSFAGAAGKILFRPTGRHLAPPEQAWNVSSDGGEADSDCRRSGTDGQRCENLPGFWGPRAPDKISFGSMLVE